MAIPVNNPNKQEKAYDILKKQQISDADIKKFSSLFKGKTGENVSEASSDGSLHFIKLNGVESSCGFNALAFHLAEKVLSDDFDLEQNANIKAFWEFYKSKFDTNKSSLKEEMQDLLSTTYDDVNSSKFQNKMAFALRAYFTSINTDQIYLKPIDNKGRERLALLPETGAVTWGDQNIEGVKGEALVLKGDLDDEELGDILKHFNMDLNIISKEKEQLIFRLGNKNRNIFIYHEVNHYDLILPSDSKVLEIISKNFNYKYKKDKEETVDKEHKPLEQEIPASASLRENVDFDKISAMLMSDNFKNLGLKDSESNNLSQNTKQHKYTSNKSEINVINNDEGCEISFKTTDKNDLKDEAFKYVKFLAGICKQQGIQGTLTIHTNDVDKAKNLLHYALIFDIPVDINKENLAELNKDSIFNQLHKISTNKDWSSIYKDYIIKNNVKLEIDEVVTKDSKIEDFTNDDKGNPQKFNL
jgi:hypothetical protein